MIKFFRKIRQKLLSESEFSKYLLYAIGEIVLVVIGILIALQINNWNLKRIETNEEKVVLKSMFEDFTETKQRVENTMKLQSRTVEYCKKLMFIMYQDNENVNTDSIRRYLHIGALSYWRIEPVNGTYDALIGSGKIEIIKNKSLKRRLADYSTEVKYGFEDEKYSLDLNLLLTEMSSVASTYLISDNKKQVLGININIDPIEKAKAVKTLLNDKSFLGVLDSKQEMERNRLDYQKIILSLVDKIINDLNEEINK